MSLPEIYTDGSCLKNPGGSGGWAFTLLENGEQWSMVGNEKSTTNNRMELQAVIEALNFVQGPEYVIYTDSELTMKCALGIYSRKANKDLWEEYNRALDDRKLHWVWVKAHNGNLYNDYVDMLARLEAKSIKK
jgi:ribonuclease HI